MRVERVRIDQLLLEQGMIASLSLARAKIMAGQVFVEEVRVTSPAQRVLRSATLRVKASKRYVSRGGKKLELALKSLRLRLKGRHVLDIGASTGGFTDCCLQHGAASVTAVDVGTNQLAWSLRCDPRVKVFEKTDIRVFAEQNYQHIDFVVVDVSFISLTSILPTVLVHLPQAEFLVLVKPQFELPRHLVPRGGVVHDNKLRQRALLRIKKLFSSHNYCTYATFDCGVSGVKGNREIFCYAHSTNSPSASGITSRRS